MLRLSSLIALMVLAAPLRGWAEEPEQVEYGSVDAATLRVFAIGAVEGESFTVRGQEITVANPQSGHGTGFAVDVGIVMTAYHVVEGARHITVRLPGDGGFYAARLVHFDAALDVAVLQIDASPPALTVAADATLKVRQTVFAIGYPLDPTRTQAQSSKGIVSAHYDDNTLQLDMALNPGNSGGPVVDEQDRVVGMVVARGDPEKGVQGIGFAVRAKRLVKVLEEARRRLDAGQVAALTDRQRQSAVVVDELVQQGVFHDLRGQAELKDLKTEDVQKALDKLAERIEDPDLLAFVAGSLWNASLGFWAADDEMLKRAGISREKAQRLVRSFGKTAGQVSRKAYKMDPDVAARSPVLVKIMMAWPEADATVTKRTVRRRSARRRGGQSGGGESASSLSWQDLGIELSLRAVSHLRLNPSSGNLGAGGGFGVGLGFEKLRFRLASMPVLPTIGVGYGTVEMFDETPGVVSHTFLSFEVGLTAEVWRCRDRRVEISAVYAPGSYAIEADVENQSPVETSEAVYGHARLAGGYRWKSLYLGTGVRLLDGPTFWFEPITFAMEF